VKSFPGSNDAACAVNCLLEPCPVFFLEILLTCVLPTDDILTMLVKPMRAGVTCTVLMDCCHSGTVLDLPYRFGADDSQMHLDKGFSLGKFGVQEAICCAMLACMVMSMMDGDGR
jgi:hypothetical protein